MSAATRGTFADPVMMVAGVIGVSVPTYWLGEVVNLLTQDKWHSGRSLGCRRSAT